MKVSAKRMEYILAFVTWMIIQVVNIYISRKMYKQKTNPNFPNYFALYTSKNLKPNKKHTHTP